MRKYLDDMNAARVEPAEEKDAPVQLCPFGRASQGCTRERCALWDDDYKACSMSSRSLYNILRDAVTDAAVDVVKAYGVKA